MKKTAITILGIALLIAACGQMGGFTVTGNIQGLSGKVILTTLDENGKYAAVDSADVTDGTFTLSGKVQGPQEARLTVEGKRGIPMFFLENGTITISGKADSLTGVIISGSATQEIMDGINEKLQPLQEEMQPLYAAYREAQNDNDAAKIAEIRDRANEISNKQQAIIKEEAEANAATAIGPYYLYRQLRYDLSLPELKDRVAAFSGTAKNTIYYDLLEKSIAVLETVDIGKTAPEFEMENPDGKMIKLSDFRGKYLLIDFWASWCGPCRQENPNVVKLYKEVQGKDFDILGVSLDNSREAWLKGIEEDGLIWNHVSDVKYWDNRVAKLYGVNSIPHTVLLDKEGVIIAKNLRGEELRAKVMELLK
ncbi:redoxin domain-containing protein [bacterium]|nr:redoxin domain-containing protein [bacterium]